MESMQGLKRTHSATELNAQHIGETVTVMGWVHKRRNLGQLVFISLRDRSGLIQAVLNGETQPELAEKAKQIKTEYVVAIVGKVIARTEGNINPDMATGMIEIEASEVRILSEAETPPFTVLDEGVKDDMRLKYRYLDLRSETMQRNIITRHQAVQALRSYLNTNGFIDIETPMLTKSTPEGARDYLVPSRIYPGSFFALPQSPQIFKQLLMVSGFEKYYQVVKCFRDEDLRADRQPEFTQLDMELSFVDQEDIFATVEGMLTHLYKSVQNIDLPTPFPRMSYAEAMNRFGSDKPDTRFGLELVDLTHIVSEIAFEPYQNAIKAGGSIRAINAVGLGNMPRKKIDALGELAKYHKAKGLSYIIIQSDGSFKTALSKFFSDEKLGQITAELDGKPGDLILICADKNNVVFDVLGNMRQHIARENDLIDERLLNFLWVIDWPLLEYDEESERYFAAHHPFTKPAEADLHLLETDPGAVKAQAYDIVLNGFELGGGSIRINTQDLQSRMFKALGFEQDEIDEKFGFLIDAFKYGTPPHAGIALGVDRLAMLMTGSSNIRDVIAFPKVKDTSCPLTSAPGDVDPAQLGELGLSIPAPTQEAETTAENAE